MPPRSPLPRRHGLDAAWVRTPDRDPQRPVPWTTLGEWLRHRLPDHVDVAQMLTEQRFVHADARPVGEDEPYRPHTFLWFHRELRAEPEVPRSLTVVHRDDRIVVVDKPPFLSTIPRGRHVTQSVVVRLRQQLGLPELSPAHRLDRITSGLLVLTTERRWRPAYQSLFEQRAVHKVYRALAPLRRDLTEPVLVRNHLQKHRGVLQAHEVPGAPVNAETLITLERVVAEPEPDHDGEHPGTGQYLLRPRTGRTHQLRLHLASLGVPILGDPLYPHVREVDVDDFGDPLQLLACELSFTDPVDGTSRHLQSHRTLPID